MRWIWIDKFVEFQSGKRAVAVKNVTLAEEHLHDHFPGFPIMPECLMIEAMAQTAGILVGQAKNFEEKVILAKIKKCVFFDYVRPGDTIKLEATIESIEDDTTMYVDIELDAFFQQIATIIPEIPTTVKNREFLVSGHACTKLTTTLTEIVQFNRVKLADTTGLEPGDLCSFLSDIDFVPNRMS